MKRPPVVVVGAGLGGLSAACHLAGKGVDVVVVEAGDGPGGRAGSIGRGGYRFDTGPTVLTMPDLIARCFAAVGVDMAEVLTLRPVDPMYRACFADGSELHVRHGREAMADEIREVCGPADAASFHLFCDWLTKLYQLEMPDFIERNFDSVLDLARPLRPAIALARMGGLRRLNTMVERYFADERLLRIFSFQAMYAGLAPYEALAIYAVITYMDTVNGVFVPVGGVHALPLALAAAAENAGVTFRYGARVDRILLASGSRGAVRGVRLENGEVIATDTVVCNPDLPVAYRTLLPGLTAPRAARRGRYSPSAIVWHAGVKGALPPRAAHHNIHFGREWDKAFRSLIHDGTRMPDPSLLVTVPTIDEPSMAPDGRHVLYVLEPVPNLDGTVDWTTERPRARASIEAAVARLGYPTDVEVEHFVDPLDWESQGMERGTPFGLAHLFFQTGPFRPGNVDAKAPGLVFVGSSTVPGVGVPMVLVSGQLAAERVEQFRKRS
ncbi:MAG: phytoene desaturase family protein [Acidimicrobiia bacterium]